MTLYAADAVGRQVAQVALIDDSSTYIEEVVIEK